MISFASSEKFYKYNENASTLLQQGVRHAFVQLSQSLSQLNNEQYTRPSVILFNATIGQHVRHIIELFTCLETGYETGVVNYEKRKRDHLIENDKELASILLQRIYANLDRPNKNLLLQSGFDEHSSETVITVTNYHREIIYNLEHAVHHMAMIRIGINEVSSIKVSAEFGVATSTIKNRNRCAP
jgi:hypothetical protein